MKYNTENTLNSLPIFSLSELYSAMNEGTILQSQATMLDACRNLHIYLGEFNGIMPYEECADGVAENEIRDVALVSRVGKTVSFTVTAIEVPNVYLSRAIAQKRCKEEYVNKLNSGDVISCLVTHIASFGAFCDVGCGINALLPIDCMSVSRITSPSERVYAGQQIFCAVKGRDEKGRLILSLKELLGTWTENASRFNVGETVMGIVRSCEPYGVFVELTPNLSGLAESSQTLQKGQLVSVYIKSIIPEKMKIKLSIVSVCDISMPVKPLEYTICSGHIDKWIYTPDTASRQIETIF